MDLFTKIDHVNYATEDAFPYGADVRILDPSAGKGAEAAQQEALEAAAVCPLHHFQAFLGTMVVRSGCRPLRHMLPIVAPVNGNYWE